MGYIKERSLIATNILIYTDDAAWPDKQNTVLTLLEEGWNNGNLILSTQLLQKYFSAVTKKLGVAAAVAQQKIELLGCLDIDSIDHESILRAIVFIACISSRFGIYSLSEWLRNLLALCY